MAGNRQATGGRVLVGSLWERQFTGGMVAVNPSGTTHSLALHSIYLTTGGRAVSSITLAPHSGAILIS